MDSFMSLHIFAARRGEGLHPELARLLQARARLGAGGVTDLQLYNGAGHDQAGPNPVGEAWPAQHNVIPLAARQNAADKRRRWLGRKDKG